MRLYLKTGAFCKKSHYQSQRLEYKIYFAAASVQNLFCSGFRAKFILQRLECKIYFAFCAIGVQNLFCKDPIFNAPYPIKTKSHCADYHDTIFAKTFA